MKINILFLFIFIFSISITSCGNQDNKSDESTTQENKAVPKELTDLAGMTSYYECPMKCEGKKFAEAGACPVCGMDLVLIETKKDTVQMSSDSAHNM